MRRLAAPLALLALGAHPVPAQDAPHAGTLCYWAITVALHEIGGRCYAPSDAALQQRLAEGAARLERLARDRTGMDDATIAGFTRQMSNSDQSDAELCAADGKAMYESFRQMPPDQIDKDVTALIARPGTPSMDPCL